MPAPSYALDKVRQHVRRYVSIEKGQNLRADVFIAERSVSFSTFPNARATPSAAPPSVAYRKRKKERERESLTVFFSIWATAFSSFDFSYVVVYCRRRRQEWREFWLVPEWRDIFHLPVSHFLFFGGNNLLATVEPFMGKITPCVCVCVFFWHFIRREFSERQASEELVPLCSKLWKFYRRAPATFRSFWKRESKWTKGDAIEDTLVPGRRSKCNIWGVRIRVADDVLTHCLGQCDDGRGHILGAQLSFLLHAFSQSATETRRMPKIPSASPCRAYY